MNAGASFCCRSQLIFNSEEKGRSEREARRRERKAGFKMQLAAVLWGALITLLLSRSSGKEMSL